VNWFVWRVVTHEQIRAPLVDVQERWSVLDLVDAHLVANVYDELAFLTRQKLQEKTGR
jgi:hypothetical protein